jgi:preprotein translocase subunit SecD
MVKKRITALLVLIIGVVIGLFVSYSQLETKAPPADAEKATDVARVVPFKPFKLGLDLSGGTHLVYRADVKEIKAGEVNDAMASLRDVIERRINIFGVSEPVVTVENGGFSNAGEERLSIDLPGVTDTEKAIAMIGQTPLLEFKVENPDMTKEAKIVDGELKVDMAEQFKNTELTGRYLDKAILEFNPNSGEPVVSIQFDAEGSKLFEQITRDNVGKTVAIFLDGQPISVPRVNEAISGGKAQISGNFQAEEAKILVGRLNSGALPVPIELISTQTIGATLGTTAVHAGVKAALIGFLVIALFLIVWYRLPGLIAVVALSMYVSIMLALFKLIPVTLTAAGMAGFIISIGIAVDANVLIFERIKEELKAGQTVAEAIRHGFSRAWFSIRDSNTSSIITAIILFWFGTALIKGFALTFLLGVIVSMISAISITRLFLYSLNITKTNKVTHFLFGSGFSSTNLTK